MEKSKEKPLCCIANCTINFRRKSKVKSVYRFSNRGGGRHEQEVAVPLGSPALDERPDLATPQAQVNDRVQTLLPVENDAIHMLPIQHQLCSN